ncbi:hypothetical protein [Propionivibrio sp.]|uniref:hypothetical protein n=1 Tax=Propionivibrio sp. TaxID=2212460 RepID=UPI003BF0C3AC
MRIPSEATTLYLSESDNKAFSEDKGPQPVDGSAKLRASLPHSLPKQRQASEENLEGVEQGQNQHRKRRQSVGKNGIEERRQGERRKANLPVLLDTRLTRSRRESARQSAISIDI